MDEKNKGMITLNESSDETAVSASTSEACDVELIEEDSKKTKAKQPGRILALLSMIFAFVSLFFALANLLFGVLTVVMTLVFKSIPFLHAVVYVPALVIAVLAIIFACVAKKKGYKTFKNKLGLIIGIISAAILALSILGMTVLGIIAWIAYILFGITSTVLSTAVSTILGFLVTVTPALAPILALIGSILLAVVPIIVESFSDAAAPEIVEFIMEWIRSLTSSGAIFLPIV